jgi:hypothetical protein
MSRKLLSLRSLFTLIATLTLASHAAAQTAAPAPVAPAPTPPPPSAAPPSAAPTAAPAEAPPAVAPTAAPPPVAPTDAPLPPPADPLPPAPPPADSAQATEPRYDGQLDENGRAHYGDEEDDWQEYEDPSYPEPEEDPDSQGRDSGFTFPAFSIRLDPFNWLIKGRLGLELEVGLGELPLTLELVPVFIADDEPPSFNFEGREDPISQHSNGLGPIAGASLGIGWWFQDRAFNGYVLRAVLTNIGINYEASDGDGVFDRVTFTERRFVVYIGSHSRFGFFTIAGGIGLGYELNQQERCYTRPEGTREVMVLTSGCDEEQQIALDRPGSSVPQVTDLNGWLHPVYLEGRFSIGVSFD